MNGGPELEREKEKWERKGEKESEREKRRVKGGEGELRTKKRQSAVHSGL